MPFSTYGAHHL